MFLSLLLLLLELLLLLKLLLLLELLLLGRTGKGVGHLRLRLCAQLDCPWRGESPSMAYAGVRAGR